MSVVPKASQVLTPKQFGAEAPAPRPWPLNDRDTAMYRINKIYPTVQGEGSKAGTAMTIVRLQGCPVGCVFCDTPESWYPEGGERTKTAYFIAREVLDYPPRWALVTGGEPCWHDLGALTFHLMDHGIRRALETSGVYPIRGLWNWVTISPKPRGLMAFDPSTLEFVDEIKWLVGKPSDVEDLERWLWMHEPYLFRRRQAAGRVSISVQPISTSARATDLCVDALMKNPDWRLSLQTHKMMRIA